MVLSAVILMSSTMCSPSIAPVISSASEMVAVPGTCLYVIECYVSAGDQPRQTFYIRATSQTEAINQAKEQYCNSHKIVGCGWDVKDKRDCD
jgi:hypothetical protein